MSEDEIRKLPGALLTAVDQPLSAEDYAAQHHKHFTRRAAGGAIGVIRNGKDQVILAKRSGMHPGWSLPGGTVEEGEDFEQAFAREIAEEIGISVDAPELVEIERKRFHSPTAETFDFTLAVFVARMIEDDLPETTAEAIAEGLTVRLFGRDEIPPEMILGDREKLLKYW